MSAPTDPNLSTTVAGAVPTPRAEADTTAIRPFEDRRWYGVRVRVTGARIQAWLDDQPIIDVNTSGRRIGVRPEVDASRPLGVASYRTRAALRGIQTRSIAPEA